MSAGEFAKDEPADPEEARPPAPTPLERVPRERFVLAGTRGLRLRARWWLVTCGPTSRPWLAFALCLVGIIGVFLPLAYAADGGPITTIDVAESPAVLMLFAFGILTLLPVIDLVLGRERCTPWLAVPAALGLQVSLALAVVAAAQGVGVLAPRFAEGVSAPGAGVFVLGGVEVGLAVAGGIGFARRAARRRLGLA